MADKMKCRICGSKNKFREYKVEEIMFGINESFVYLECIKCGCVQIADIPDNLSKYYPDNYYSLNSNVKYAKTKFNEILRTKRDRFIVFKKGIIGRYVNKFKPNTDPHLDILTHIPSSKGSQILDVGCGGGQFLQTLARIGFKNLEGIDPFIDEDLKYESGVRIYKKSIFDFKKKKDIIMFHHSFEHMPEQLETLNAVHDLLNNDGFCIVRVPTVSSYAWRHYKEKWVQFDAPRHLFLHSLESMKVLTEKASLYIDNIIYDSTAYQFLGSEKILKGFPLHDDNSFSSLFSSGQIKQFKERALELNEAREGDACAFIIRKNRA